MGKARCSVAHNPISNQKLGAGIAPFRRLLDAGVNVALGTDGISSRMLDVMHVAAILHKVTSPNYKLWPTANEVLRAATIGGARSAMINDQVGSLEVGKKADLVMFNTKSINFTPLNDLRNHVVYCENGASITTVIVNGDVVVKDAKLIHPRE